MRCDSTCNPHLAFAAMLMTGLDGIQNKIDPGKPIDKDIYEFGPEQKKSIKSTPGPLGEVLEPSRRTTTSSWRVTVFTEEPLETWISYKRKNELEAVALRPCGYEFSLYYDI